MSDDRDALRHEFEQLVNMSPKEIEDWLGTEESRSVGATTDGEAKSGTGAVNRSGTRRAGGSSRSCARARTT